MGLQPIHNNLLIKLPDKPEEQVTAGGIYLPDTSSQGLPMKGKVVSAGKGKITNTGKLMPMRFKEGDIVVFKQFSGIEITLDNKQHVIMPEDNILGTLDDEQDIDN
tara:strand:+ start:56 stop:373 length:318 start_codon:yes stop_codon:yes gene_type:complete